MDPMYIETPYISNHMDLVYIETPYTNNYRNFRDNNQRK